MSKVKITPNGKTGSIITAYAKNPEFGYVQLTQSTMIIDGGWVRESKRSALLRGKVSLLEEIVKMYKGQVVPGQLVVKEYVESAVPQEMRARFLNNEALTHEEQIAPFVKRAGEEGPELTLGGERILRFTLWDQAGTDVDVKVMHDNGADIRSISSGAGASLEANS